MRTAIFCKAGMDADDNPGLLMVLYCGYECGREPIARRDTISLRMGLTKMPFMQFFSDRYGRPTHTVATASDYGSPRKITVTCKKTMWRSNYICFCGKYCPITSRPVLIEGIFLIY